MRRRTVLLLVFALAVLLVSVVTAAALSGSTRTDEALFVKPGSSDKTLDQLVKRSNARGVQVKEYSITKRDDGEPVYQIVLDPLAAESASLDALYVWHEAALLKAAGSELPLVEVMCFDTEGKLLYGCATDPVEIKDPADGNALPALAVAQDILDARLTAALNALATETLRAQIQAAGSVSQNEFGERVASIAMDLPMGATDVETSSLLNQVGGGFQKLCSDEGAGIVLLRIVVTLGGKRVLEDVWDNQTSMRSTWWAPGYAPTVPDAYASPAVK